MLDQTLSGQLSDYGVDVPYIQAHIHGLSSRSVLDLDDLPTVLPDEAVNAAAALDAEQPTERLGRGHSRTGAHVGRHRQARWLNAWTSC